MFDNMYLHHDTDPRLWNDFIRLLQVSDLQEGENRVGPLFRERGTEGSHLLLPANDRGQRWQLGHLRRDRGAAWEWRSLMEIVQTPSFLICSLKSPWKMSSVRPSVDFGDPGLAGGLTHYNVWTCDMCICKKMFFMATRMLRAENVKSKRYLFSFSFKSVKV